MHSRPLLQVLSFPICLLAIATSLSASPQSDAEQAIRSSGIESADVSVCVIDAETGQKLVDINAAHPRIPASNMKLLTSGAAARLLGRDFQFKTRLLRDGNRLIVVGDGDPAFGDPDLLMKMIDAHGRPMDIESFLDIWADAVAETGMTRVDELVIDDRVFDRKTVHPSWPTEQLVKRYCAGVNGLMFHRNIIQFYPQPGTAGSNRANLTRTKPQTDFLLIRNLATSSKTKRASDLIDVQRSHGDELITIRGNVTKPMTAPIEVTVHDMPTVFGRLLAQQLRERGIRVTSVQLAQFGDPPSQGQQIDPAIVTPLAQVLERCNVDSYNLYAEALLKKLGATYTRSAGTWDNGSTVVRHMIQTHLSRPDATLRIADGSGMSRENRVSAATFAQWLATFDPDDPDEAFFIESLPEPGEGTLKKRFLSHRNQPIRIQAKSGYLNGICTLSGYVIDQDGHRLCFSILVNDPGTPARKAKALHEAIVMKLVEELDQQRLSKAAP